MQPISRAGIACHWEDNDVVAQEVYYNVRMNLINSAALSDIIFPQDSLICVCIALAIA